MQCCLAYTLLPFSDKERERSIVPRPPELLKREPSARQLSVIIRETPYQYNIFPSVTQVFSSETGVFICSAAYNRDLRRILLVEVREIVACLLRDDAREQQHDHGKTPQPAVKSVDHLGEFLHFYSHPFVPLHAAAESKKGARLCRPAPLRNNISIIPDSEPKIKSRPPIW